MSENLHVLVGLGMTTLSCAHYLTQKNIPIAFADTRQNPPNLSEFKRLFPKAAMALGQLDDTLFDQAAVLVVTPGISVRTPAIARQSARGIPVVGDIELFALAVNAPVLAITGTNAKSTVTTLVAEMAIAAGLKTKVGGNLGVPALDLLTIPAPQLYVLELSSFQLETTYSLKPAVAAILNVTPDHMDRYDTLQDYQQAKQRIYHGCEVAVYNRDDCLTDCDQSSIKRRFRFTLNQPGQDEFGLLKKNGDVFLAFEQEPLVAVKALPLLGRHYHANALAALAIGHAYGLPFDAMLKALMAFKGLPHRCQLVRTLNDVTWYNDSKGTNVGATIAAIEGLGTEITGKLILIAGGLGKNADFSPLNRAIEKYVREVILIGEAAPILAKVLNGRVEKHFAGSMAEAVKVANHIAKPGDSVLLSPACASWDMFKNFEHRGDVFTEIVLGLT